jgi:hypothetical protein
VATSAYNHELRAIGQALEARGISNFELKTRLGQYVVSGAPEKPHSLAQAFRQLRHNQWRLGERSLAFHPQELRELASGARRLRRRGGRLPDFYNVSNVLRTVGAYLDSKDVRLVEIQKKALTLTLLYQGAGGHPQMEDRTIVSFYEMFMQLYEKRGKS